MDHDWFRFLLVVVVGVAGLVPMQLWSRFVARQENARVIEA